MMSGAFVQSRKVLLSPRHRRLLHRLLNNLLIPLPGVFRFCVGHDSVGQNGNRKVPNIFGDDVIAAAHQGGGLGGAIEGE